jgi:hypothetical protein
MILRKFLSISLLIFVLLVPFSASSQLEVTSSICSVYPTDTVILNDRNPQGIDTSIVTFVEGQTRITPLSVKEIDFSKEAEQGKCVLILFENHKDRNEQREFFKELIQSVATEIVNSNDEFLFGYFDWDSKEANNGKTLYLLSETPTNDPAKLIELANSVVPKSRESQRASTLIYHAVMEGVDFLKNFKTEKPKSILILSAGFADLYRTEYDATAAIKASLDNHISVYSIQYLIGYKHNLERLADETYGLYGSFERQNKDAAEQSVINFMAEVESRDRGRTYEIVFETTHPKDGQLHSSTLEIGDQTMLIPVQMPKPNMLDWIKANLILSILLGLVVITLIILVIILIKKNKRQKELEAAQSNQRFSEVEEKNQQAQEQIRKQEEILKHKDERERIQQEKALEEQREIARAKKEAEQIVLMKQGGLPRLSGTFQGQHGELTIDVPLVTIGRKETNYYTLNHVTISGNHAEIRFLEGKYFVKDLNSTNGIRVNGRKIVEQELKHGDVVEFGEIALTYLK